MEMYLKRIAVPDVVIVAAVVILFVVRGIAFRFLHRWAERTETRIDDIIVIPGFGESSLDFTLICQVQEFTDQYLVQHELRKNIFKRFRDEGIHIPFPHRTVYLREEKEWQR